MNCKLFNKIVIWIAIIALAITPMVYFVYFVGIGAIWTRVDNEASPITATATVVLALTSIVVALVGFFTYFRENEKNRIEKIDRDRQIKFSVKPFLVLETVRDGDDNTVEITLTNDGAGIAFIKEYVLYYKGEEVARDNANYKRFFQKDLEKLENYKTTKSGHLGSGSSMKADEKKILWSAKYNPKDKDMDGTILNRLDYYIEYQSIYGEEGETFICDSRGGEDFYEKLIS